MVKGAHDGELPIEDLLSNSTPLSDRDVKRVQEAMRSDASGRQNSTKSDDTFNALRGEDEGPSGQFNHSDVMSEDSIVDLLRTATNWTDTALREIVHEATVTSLDAGDIVFLEGDQAKFFYILLSGTVSISKSTPKGPIIQMCTVPTAKGFGWEALENPSTHEYTATAVHAAQVLEIRSSVSGLLRSSSWNIFQARVNRNNNLLRTMSYGDKYMQLLRSTKMFSNFTPGELRFLALLATREHFEIGKTITASGEKKMYVVESGRVMMRSSVWDDIVDWEHPIEPKTVLLSRGAEINGCAVLYNNWKSTFTSECHSECYMASLSATNLQNFSLQYPTRRLELEASSLLSADTLMRRSFVPLFHKRTQFSSDGKFLEEEYLPGTQIFHVGDPGERFYVIISGLVEISDSGGTIIATLGPGDYFGEVAFIRSSGEHIFGARASKSEKLHVYTTDRTGFSQLFASDLVALAEIEIRVHAGQVSLESLLNHPEALQTFSLHMMKEHAFENVDFFVKSRKYAILFAGLDVRYGVDPDQKINNDDDMRNLIESGILDALRKKRLLDIDKEIKSMKAIAKSNEDTDKINNSTAMDSALWQKEVFSASNSDNTIDFDESTRILIKCLRRHFACELHRTFIVENSPKQVNHALPFKCINI